MSTPLNQYQTVTADDIVCVASYPSVIEADLIRAEIESAGIEAWVADSTAAQTILPIPEVGMMVLVHTADAERARLVIDSTVTDAEIAADPEANFDNAENPEV